MNNDGHTSWNDDGAVPSDGDPSVCIYCGSLSIFANDAKSCRRPTDEEREVLLADPEVVRAMRAIRMVHVRKVAPYN